jgi:hypothetical protein
MNNISHVTAAARERLESIVSTGIARSGSVIQQILSQQPVDAIVPAKGLTFQVADDGTVAMAAKGHEWGLHRHAFDQVVERAGIPRSYAGELRVTGTENEWRRTLLQHSMDEHYRNNGASRYLVRSVDGEARGFLSDKYRRLDSRPLLESFITACQALQGVPYEGVATDTRASVRVIIPQVFEPVPGEAMVLGLAWQNSDFGAGTYGISAFVLRLVCLNGMVGESALKQVHLGGRLPDELTFSEKTYALDTKTMVSATGDVVRSVLAPAAIEKRMDAVRAAHESTTDFASAWKKLRSTGMSKAEQTATRDAFEGEDVVMLPPGKTMWRFSNALSWTANTTKDAERKLELQALAGAVIAA